MPPENLRFGGGVAETVLNPAVAIVVLIAGILICVLPRNKAIVPFLAAAILIPMDQVLLVGGLHFPMMRILILFGLIRIGWMKASSGSRLFSGGMNRLDLVVILFAACSALAGVLLWQDSKALVFQLGELYTVFGVYVLLRFLVRDRQDVERVLRSFACIVAVIAVVMVYERVAGRNPYALLGGARASVYGVVVESDYRVRAMGCFGHPILAGTFGAISLPLFATLWLCGRKNRAHAVAGFLGATLIVITANSSTPVLAYAAGILGLCLWPLRNWMRPIRWGIVLMLVSLHMVMKAPVWHLISRIEVISGSSSYHRYQLVNQFILHFGDWWLVGTKSNADWGWLSWDTANQYVETGQKSGLLVLLLFLAIIVYGFKYLGRARRVPKTNRRRQLILWSLGCALLANAVAFFGISYFDQTLVAWYALLAMISAACVRPRKPLPAPLTVDSALDSANQDRDPDLVPTATNFKSDSFDSFDEMIQPFPSDHPHRQAQATHRS